MATGGGERIVQASVIPLAGGRVVASPFQFYFDGNDNLRVEGWNTAPGATLQVFGRFVRANGEVNSLNHVLPLTADRLRNVSDFAVGDGYMLNLVVVVTGATPKIGQTFARVSVIRGLSGATIVLGIMLQGTVTSQQALAWPGSPIASSLDGPGVDRTLVCTVPAAANPISETVPTGARWSILAAYAALLTDANVGNRIVYFEHMPLGTPVYISVHPQTAPATTGSAFFWACGFPIETVPANNLTTANLSTPSILTEGDRAQINFFNEFAGDQFTDGRLQLLEWLEVK